MASVYQINKGINKPIEMKGLKAQYIIYLAVGLVIILIGFIIAYMAGANPYLCVGIALTLGFFLFSYTYKFSNKYGEHGLIKATAYRKIPAAITCNSRNVFHLNPEHVHSRS